MDNTILSTEKMSSEIDHVIVTIEENVGMLQESIDDVRTINSSMSGIKVATQEINAAMESSSKDAEHLSVMTAQINNYAIKSQGYAQNIAEIDQQLSQTTKGMIQALSGGHNELGDQDLIQITGRAIESHQKWLEKLEGMVERMEIEPIQTDATRCAFGHYYTNIIVNNPTIQEPWQEIDPIHHEFHKLGDRVLEAIRHEDQQSATTYLAQAKGKSQELGTLLNHIQGRLKTQLAKPIDPKSRAN